MGSRVLSGLVLLAAGLLLPRSALALSSGPSCSPVNEVCDGADNDCDGVVDNGVTNACGQCGAVPSETCNGADDDCDGQVDEGVANACGGCGPTPVERCNGLDDNCNGAVDESLDCTGVEPLLDLDVGASSACVVHGEHLACWTTGAPADVTASGDIADAGGLLTGVVAVSAGGYDRNVSTCALLDDARVACFGQDVIGSLGYPPSASAVLVPGVGGTGILGGVAQVSVGSNFACAALEDGSAVCWGQNDDPLWGDGTTYDFHGQLGNGTANDSAFPTRVVGVDGVGTLSGVVQVAAGHNHACALLADGHVACWGWRAAIGGAGTETRCLSTAQQCTGIWPFRTCKTVCTQYGQVDLYNESLVPRFVLAGEGPSDANGFLVGATSIDAALGRGGGCAGLSDGGAVCWAPNDATFTTTPRRVVAPTTLSSVVLGGYEEQYASGYQHRCVLETSHEVACTGHNNRRQGGRDPTSENTWPTVDYARIYDPTGASWLTGVLEIDSGREFNCALRATDVVCWGAADFLGQATRPATDSGIPLIVPLD